MRITNTKRQANEDREEKKKRRMEGHSERANGRNVREPGSASLGPHVPGEGAAREGSLADRPEVGTGPSERENGAGLKAI